MVIWGEGPPPNLTPFPPPFVPAEQQFCGGRLEKEEGTLKTPNWPEENYPAGISCSWHIVAPPDKVGGGGSWGGRGGL